MHSYIKAIALGTSSLLLVANLAGCGSKDASATPDGSSKAASDGDKGGDKGGKKDGAESGKGGTKTAKLEKLGLKMDVETPEDPQVNEMGEMGTMVSSGKATVTVSAAKDTDPKTIEQEKSADDLFTPKNFKSEKLPDGWLVTFDNTGSAGANYFLTVFRKIGDKSIRCTTMLGDDPARAEALKMCKALKS